MGGLCRGLWADTRYLLVGQHIHIGYSLSRCGPSQITSSKVGGVLLIEGMDHIERCHPVSGPIYPNSGTVGGPGVRARPTTSTHPKYYTVKQFLLSASKVAKCD